jgi:hypothetical protein
LLLFAGTPSGELTKARALLESLTAACFASGSAKAAFAMSTTTLFWKILLFFCITRPCGACQELHFMRTIHILTLVIGQSSGLDWDFSAVSFASSQLIGPVTPQRPAVSCGPLCFLEHTAIFDSKQAGARYCPQLLLLCLR